MCPNHISGETETVHDLTPTRLTDLIDRVFENGYTPLPIKPGSKIPGALVLSGHDEGTFVLQWRNLGGWQSLQVTDASIDEWRNWSRAGLGIRGDNVVGIDIDVDDPAEAQAVEAIVVDVLGVTPLRRVGRPPRPMLVYRHDGSLRKVVLAKHRDSGHKVEAIARGSQFVAFAVHPDTRRPYEWTAGHSPIDTHVDDLPEVTAAHLDEISRRLAERWQCDPMPEHAAEVRLGELEHVRPVARPDLDPLFQEFDRRGLLQPGDPSAAGYYPVTCPLAHEHTDGADDGAGYLPGNPGSFICHHSHGDTFRRGQVRQRFIDNPHGDTPTPDLRDPAAPLLSQEDRDQLTARLGVERTRQAASESAARDEENPARRAATQAMDALAIVREALAVSAYVPPDRATLPRRDWIMRPSFLRGDLSTLVAPGGVGKSLMTAAEALSLASGKGLLAPRIPPRACRVAIINAEDKFQELELRIAAAMKRNGLTNDHLGDRLFLIAPRRAFPIVRKSADGAPMEARDVVDEIIEFLKHNHIDALIIDPLASFNKADETNEGMQCFVEAMRRIADEAGVAVRIVHHVNKAGDGDVRSARGGTAFTDGVRQADALATMTAKEAQEHGINPATRRAYVRLIDGKANYAAVDDDHWFHIVPDTLENGEHTVALVPHIMQAVAAPYAVAKVVHDDLTTHGPQWRDLRSDPWFGWTVARLAGEEGADQHTDAAKRLAKRWLKALTERGVILETSRTHNGRDRPAYSAGTLPLESEWNPIL